MIETQAFSKLKPLADSIKQTHLKSLFEDESNRFEQFHVQTEHLLYDFSKQKINSEVLQELLNLATESDLQPWIEKLFAGEKINQTEDRAAWHTALRDINNPLTEVAQQWRKMEHIVNLMHSHQLRGFFRKRHYRRGQYWSGR